MQIISNCRASASIWQKSATHRAPPNFSACILLNVLRHLTGHVGFASKDVIAVGDGENDICLLRAVPLSFAFQPKSGNVRAAARYVIDDSLADLLGVVPQAEMSDREQKTDLLVVA
jgi:hypothetical protein